MQSIWFLGRLHVLILHLPLGILTLAVALEVLVRFRRFKFLESALAPTWIAGAVSALATVRSVDWPDCRPMRGRGPSPPISPRRTFISMSCNRPWNSAAGAAITIPRHPGASHW